jgi:hypothetical protein
MRKLIKTSIIIGLITITVFGQFKNEVSDSSFPLQASDAQNKSFFSLLDPNRFEMNHIFSAQMLSFGNRSMSVGSYTNLMTYMLNPNLRLNTSLTLLQSGMSTSALLGNNNTNQLYYSTFMDYKPNSNTLIQFGISNYPYYFNRTSSLNLGGY